MELQLGDVIALDNNINEELEIKIGNKCKYLGVPGTVKNKIAVKITGVKRRGMNYMNDMLSQEEIDALLKGTDESTDNNDNLVNFTDAEKDTIGEVGNISMGTAATTLSTLLGQGVTITTPEVDVITFSELTKQYPIPFVAVDVKYKKGLEGTNLLILKKEDVKIITDLMMGGDGQLESGELTDLHLSAIGEAMNQMIGSSSTSLSEMLNKNIEISPPNAFVLDLATDDLIQYFENYTSYEDIFVKIAFKMIIGDLIDSKIMQLMPIEFAKSIVKGLLHDISGTSASADTDFYIEKTEHTDTTVQESQSIDLNNLTDVEDIHSDKISDKNIEKKL